MWYFLCQSLLFQQFPPQRPATLFFYSCQSYHRHAYLPLGFTYHGYLPQTCLPSIGFYLPCLPTTDMPTFHWVLPTMPTYHRHATLPLGFTQPHDYILCKAVRSICAIQTHKLNIGNVCHSTVSIGCCVIKNLNMNIQSWVC